jgi:chromate transporter
MAVTLGAADWLTLFTHFLSLSLLAVGGAITTAPDMHRYLVGSQHWLTDAQFNASIAIAQAAPGPNVLFVALIGWHVGLNAGGGAAAGWAAAGPGRRGGVHAGHPAAQGLLTWSATRWAHRNRERAPCAPSSTGMAPMVIALLMATGWVLTAAHGQPRATGRCGCSRPPPPCWCGARACTCCGCSAPAPWRACWAGYRPNRPMAPVCQARAAMVSMVSESLDEHPTRAHATPSMSDPRVQRREPRCQTRRRMPPWRGAYADTSLCRAITRAHIGRHAGNIWMLCKPALATAPTTMQPVH